MNAFPHWPPLSDDHLFAQIQRALEHAADSRDSRSVNHLACDLADAETYLRYIFRMIPGVDQGHFNLLAQQSQGSYEWMATAYRFITHGHSSNSEPRTRLEHVLGSGEGLDALYAVILGSQSNGDGREVQLMFLKLVLSLKGSLPFSALLEFPPSEYFPPGVDILAEVQHLSPLLAGIRDHPPIAPYHPSFVEFLSDAARSGPFYIDLGKC